MTRQADYIIEKHPAYQHIVARIKQQVEKGLDKYPNPVQKEEYSVFGWINHQQDELVDGLVYNEMIRSKLEDAIGCIEQIEKHSNDEFSRTQAIAALDILKGGKY